MSVISKKCTNRTPTSFARSSIWLQLTICPSLLIPASVLLCWESMALASPQPLNLWQMKWFRPLAIFTLTDWICKRNLNKQGKRLATVLNLTCSSCRCLWSNTSLISLKSRAFHPSIELSWLNRLFNGLDLVSRGKKLWAHWAVEIRGKFVWLMHWSVILP